MERDKFIALIGKDLVVDYYFGKELQRWNMKNFKYDPKTDTIKHKYLPLITEVFIPKCSNPHKGKATHGW